jgi:hypothetical protein
MGWQWNEEWGSPCLKDNDNWRNNKYTTEEKEGAQQCSNCVVWGKTPEGQTESCSSLKKRIRGLQARVIT